MVHVSIYPVNLNMDYSRDFSLVFLFSSKIVPMKSKHIGL